MTDHTSTIAALKELRAELPGLVFHLPTLRPHWLKAIDEAVEGLKEAAEMRSDFDALVAIPEEIVGDHAACVGALQSSTAEAARFKVRAEALADVVRDIGQRCAFAHAAYTQREDKRTANLFAELNQLAIKGLKNR